MKVHNQRKEKNLKDTSGLIRFFKFAVVGGSGVFVNMGFLWLFTEVFDLFYILSSILAIFIAMINNFIWNDIWTWRGKGEPGVKPFFIRLMKFCLVSSLAGYVGNLGILWVLTHFFGLHYMISNVFGIAVGTLVNYFLNNYWTFKPLNKDFSSDG